MDAKWKKDTQVATEAKQFSLVFIRKRDFPFS